MEAWWRFAGVRVKKKPKNEDIKLLIEMLNEDRIVILGLNVQIHEKLDRIEKLLEHHQTAINELGSIMKELIDKNCMRLERMEETLEEMKE